MVANAEEIIIVITKILTATIQQLNTSNTTKEQSLL